MKRIINSVKFSVEVEGGDNIRQDLVVKLATYVPSLLVCSNVATTYFVMARQLTSRCLRRVLSHLLERTPRTLLPVNTATRKTCISSRLATLSIRSFADDYGASSTASSQNAAFTAANPYEQQDVVPHNVEHYKSLVTCLRELFNFKSYEAETWIKLYPAFLILEPADIKHNYEICRSLKIMHSCIESHPMLLCEPPPLLKSKLQLMKSGNLSNDINEVVPLYHMAYPKLQIFAMKLKNEELDGHKGNRIELLAEKLQCSRYEICKILVKYSFMQTISIEKLSYVLDLLQEFNVSAEDILNDIWAFRYNVKIIKQRFEKARDAGAFPIKTWMIRCPEVTLTRRINKAAARRSVLGDNRTFLEYLKNRLNCTEEDLTQTFTKNPSIVHVNITKMEKVVDFLLESGFTGKQILQVPRVVFHKLETIKSRHYELKSHGREPTCISTLCKSQSQYEKYLENVKKKRLVTDNQ